MPITGFSFASTTSRARLRAAAAFSAAAIGLALGRAFPSIPPTPWFIASLALCATAALSSAWLCRISLAGALTLAGAGYLTARTQTLPTSDLSLLLTHDTRHLITIDALILTNPRDVDVTRTPLTWAFTSQPRQRFNIQAHRLITSTGEVPISGNLWVRVNSRSPLTLRAGDRARFTGYFDTIDPPMNPGEEDMRAQAAQSGFCGSLTLSDASLIEPSNTPISAFFNMRSNWLRLRASLESRARDVLTRAAGTDPTDRALILGLVLGDYDPTQREVRDAFARQGLAHVLSISGFHLAVMAALALAALRLTGDRGWIEPVIVATLVLLYLLIVPSSSPILRSAIMVLALLCAEASGRRYDRLTTLIWIAIGLLIWRPLDLWNAGYQLSLGLTGVLFWFGNSFNARLWGEPIKGLVRREIGIGEKVLDYLKQSISTGLMCWAVSAPLVMCRFGLISPLAIAATILITPFIILLLWLGYIALFIGILFPAAADTASIILSHLSTWSVRSVQLFDAMPISALRIPVVPGVWAAVATLTALYWIARGHLRDWRAWSAAGIVAAWLLYLFTFTSGLSRSTDLRIDTLSVGSGTCHLLRSGNDALLWDCAPMKGSGVMPPLVAAVRDLGAWRTPTVIITHPDLDHFGGLLDIAEPLGVRTVITGDLFVRQATDQPRGSAAYLINELKHRGITITTVRAGDTFTFGTTQIHFLSPPADATWSIDNDHSLVGALHHTDSTDVLALMTGDIQDAAIRALEHTYDLHPAVLELPHHGSARNAAINFTLHLNPSVVLQSTNASRANDPRWSAAWSDRAWFCTAVNGASWVEFKKNGSVTAGSIR